MERLNEPLRPPNLTVLAISYIISLRLALLLLIVPVLAGCVRVISVDYIPDSPYKARGTVRVDRFEYLPAHSGKVGPRHIETNIEGIGRYYMSKEVAVYFAGALKGELTHSGYEVSADAGVSISGTIERLYYDFVDVRDASLELNVRYTVHVGDKEMYAQPTRVFEKTPKGVLALTHLIQAATRASIHQFLHGAQEAKALSLPSSCGSCPTSLAIALQIGHQPLKFR